MYIPSPTTINNLLVVSALLGCILVVYRESKPETRMGYSKFEQQDESILKIPSRMGMLVIYSPSVILSLLAIMLLPPRHHSNWVAFMCFLHYFKRVYEVIRVHKYSGNTSARDACLISMVYITLTSIFIYLATQVPFSIIDKRQVRFGTMLFFAGELVNFYHHRILSCLRKTSSDSGYKIPEGGLFKFTWCPHYVGEIMAFVGLAIVTQNMLAFPFQSASALYLGLRASSTKAWYENRFPAAVLRAALIPGFF
ncbi:3-oxo-5-alpha-steroid 4-dehydrogenase-domain-containing protein [Phascolomyces articulosus]|uniref:3-oxo-5-alpha-steroid 4-dehydrogenase-domain-containing protein n=1 Tax=Phascolomyces articulosus TaxID=60185 RepID=A0AAD5PHI5_9FUNG|nr:3-oxo-5-alpha-steroid 4-dehydrogenase-domain-containing protein [Phascolomyces articulosus]